jgi:lactose/L-arabinose transport system substrate-binding protein
VAALKLLKRFRDEGIALQDPGSANAETAAVKNKQVATVFTTPASVFFLTGSVPKTEGDWGAIKMPAFEPGGTRGTNIGGTSLVITDQVKDPAAAWAWLNFWLLRVDSRLVSYEAGRLFENLYKPAAEDPFFQKPDPFYDGQEIPQLYAEVADEAPSFSEGKQLEQIERAFNTTANQFFAGEKSAEDFAKEIQAQVAAGQ